jgi:hypothetical protein
MLISEASRRASRPRGATWHRRVPTGIALCAAGAFAVGIAMSAILVVSRETIGNTGVVMPTQPLPTSASTSTPMSSPVATQAPSRAPANTSTAALTPTVAPSVTAPPKPPDITATHSDTPQPPSSVHPTTHSAFPHQTTDFLGPPGTNG